MKKQYTIRVSAVQHSPVVGEIEVEAMDEAEAMMKAVISKDLINWDCRNIGTIDQMQYMITAEH